MSEPSESQRARSARELINKLHAKLERGERVSVADVQLAGLEDIEANWEDKISRQRDSINRLLGIIQRARETANADTDSPEEILQKVREILR